MNEEQQVARAVRDLKAPEIWRDDVRQRRLAAIRTLKELAPRNAEAVSSLIGVLRQRETLEFALEAIQALGKIGPFAEDAVEPLLAVIVNTAENDNAQLVRRAAFEALGRIAPEKDRVVATLFKEVDAEGSDLIAALEVLSKNAPRYDPSVQDTARRLMHRHSALKPDLVRIAGNIRPDSPRTIEFLAETLHNDDRAAKFAVVDVIFDRALYRAEFLAGLTNLLIEAQSPEPPAWLTGWTLGLGYPEGWREMRLKTVTVAGQMRGLARDAAPLVANLQADKDMSLRLAAYTAYYRITGELKMSESTLREFLTSDEKKGSWWTPMAALDRITDFVAACPPSVPLLARLLKDPEKQVRYLSVRLLGTAGTNAAATVPEIRALLQDRAVTIREEASNAITRIEFSTKAK